MSCSKDINSLLSLFTEQYTKQNFENLSNAFNNILDKKSYFQFGTAIVLFLRSKEILNNQQQYLIAYYLLWELGRNENDPNPFLELIYDALTSNEVKFGIGSCPSLDPVGKTFLASVLTQPQNLKDLLKKSPMQVYQEGIIQEFDLGSIDKMINDIKNDLPHILKSGISCIIPFQDNTLIKNNLFKENVKNSEENKNINESLLLGDNPPVRRSLRPEFIRLQPPLHCTGTLDELIWLNPPHVDHQFVWDVNIGQDNNEDYIIELMKSAKSTALMSNQVIQLQTKLKENPDILKKIDFRPSELPGLVEKNPIIAIDTLLILFDTKEVAGYFSELIKMDISLHSLEVVNQLTASVELPTQFIHHYIERCIQSCHNSTDKYMHRLVRLVCVFFQSLIRNKIIDIKEIQSIILQFCLNFNSIKEANALYKLIKSANGGSDVD